MKSFTLQRVLIERTHYKYGEYFADTVRKLRKIPGRNSIPNESTVRQLITTFEEFCKCAC